MGEASALKGCGGGRTQLGDTAHEGRPARLAVVGVSLSSICGVRDHAQLLAQALEQQGVTCSTHWLSRDRVAPFAAAGSQMRAWTGALEAELRRERPDAVLLHYSVFAYSHRGVPLLVHPVLRALCRSGVPLLTVLHEFAYPWRRRGWRGTAWALTQRAMLIDVVRASRALIVTADFQHEWVASRPWLPQRRAVVAPVFSNLPPAADVGPLRDRVRPVVGPPSAADVGPLPDRARPVVGPPSAADVGPLRDRVRPVVGLFGYSAEGAAVALTLDAVRLLRERGVPVGLNLLGAPGRDSAAGEMWLAAARARGVADALSFSGILEPQALADALASCEVLLFAETAGPTTRKTTLASSLASGRPVVAIDGPRCWSELARSNAARIVPPTAPALAGAIEETLADERLRETLGARGGAFARERMSAPGNARIVGALLEEVLAQCGAEPRAANQVERAAR
jgi:glycosyltransferase involved in cell wall biosynthesis